jgi:hypothetical protein
MKQASLASLERSSNYRCVSAAAHLCPEVDVSTEQQAEEHTQIGKGKRRPEQEDGGRKVWTPFRRRGTRAGGQDRPTRPNALHRVFHPPVAQSDEPNYCADPRFDSEYNRCEPQR